MADLPFSPSRRRWLQAASAASLLAPAALASPALAQSAAPASAPAGGGAANWPTKPLRLIVPYAAGGFGDIRARQIASRLGASLGQTIVVENKPGAGGVLGTDLVAKAEPDGYTIGTGHLAPLAVNGHLMQTLPYDPLKDVAPIVLIESSPLILCVGPALADVPDVRALIALARSQPGKLTFASSGIGGAHHLSGEMFRDQAGIDITHIAYKGGAPAATDLMAGHVSMMFEMGYAALPSVKAGKTRALAVTSSKRLAVLPDVPTMAESGLAGFESYNWQGLIAPAGTPPALVERLNREVNTMLDGELKALISAAGSEPSGGTPDAFARFIRSENVKWAKLIEHNGIKPA
ncbi:MAG: tripartite tricarboxylate transporter substrate binding protein [Burkholderiaceae bacterium]